MKEVVNAPRAGNETWSKLVYERGLVSSRMSDLVGEGRARLSNAMHRRDYVVQGSEIKVNSLRGGAALSCVSSSTAFWYIRRCRVFKSRSKLSIVVSWQS
jgi:hypothetical protein